MISGLIVLKIQAYPNQKCLSGRHCLIWSFWQLHTTGNEHKVWEFWKFHSELFLMRTSNYILNTIPENWLDLISKNREKIAQKCHMIGFTMAQHIFLWIRTEPTSFSRFGICCRERRNDSEHLIFTHAVEEVVVQLSFEGLLPTPNSLRERVSGVRVADGARTAMWTIITIGIPIVNRITRNITVWPWQIYYRSFHSNHQRRAPSATRTPETRSRRLLL